MIKLTTVFIFPLVLLLAIPAGDLQAQSYDAGDTTLTKFCPKGYYPIAELNLCLSNNLDQSVVYDANTAGACMPNYEQPLGVALCMMRGLALNIVQERYLVSGFYKQSCPDHFRRSQQSTLCIADHLSLALVDHRLTLLAPKLDCQKGYQQKPRATSCTAIRDDEPGVLSTVDGPECAAGFIKPAGFNICLSFELARKTGHNNQLGIQVPQGSCPINWRQQAEQGFCIPQHSVVQCGSADFPCPDPSQGPNSFKLVVDDGGGCCPPGDEPVAWHTSDPMNSFASIPVVMCGPPVGTDHVDCEDMQILPPNVD